MSGLAAMIRTVPGIGTIYVKVQLRDDFAAIRGDCYAWPFALRGTLPSLMTNRFLSAR